MVTFNEIFKEAYEAGMEAGNYHIPTPMNVVAHTNPADDNSPIEQIWNVPSGICGFAWIVVSPGNCAFANYLKKTHDCKPAYKGGVSYWVHQFGQSYEKKVEFADAFAKVLQKHKIRAYSMNRLD